MKRSSSKSRPSAPKPPPSKTPPREEQPAPRESQGPGPKSGSAGITKLSAAVSIVTAIVLAFLVNVFVARHYRRWDVTRGGLYTLSEATLSTLHSLAEPVSVYVLLPGGEPLTLSASHLLDGYRAETSELSIHFVDPDRHPADFLSLAQRFGLDVEKDEGRVVADAAAIVSRGDRYELVRSRDLIEVDDADDVRRRPRLEQAFSSAIREVTSTDHPKACFTVGHGETTSLPLREHLTRSGFAVENIEAGSTAPLNGCSVIVIAGPTQHVSDADTARYAAYFKAGGSIFVAVGPQPDGSDKSYLDLGLTELLSAAGLALERDFVFELDPDHRSARGRGETFAPIPKPHSITQRFLKGKGRGAFPPVLTVASSLGTTGGSAATAPLLSTTEQAFGMVDFFTWARSNTPPVPTPSDKKGPLTLAFASELPKPGSSAAGHGGRLVAIGSASVVEAENFRRDDLRGSAFFVEDSIAWLTARPPLLDIPNRPAFNAGLRVSEEWLAHTFRYVVLYMPLAAILLGTAVYLRRRGTERRKDAAS